MIGGNPDAVRGSIDDAVEVAVPEPLPEEDGPRGSGLPDDFPVTPLGKSGTDSFYLDAVQQLVRLPASAHTRQGITSLVAPHIDQLYDNWPVKDYAGNVTGWRVNHVAELLQRACGRRGVWEPRHRIRGPGAWLGADGKLVLHCGDRVFVGDTWHRPGVIDGIVYPAASAIPRPSQILAPGGRNGPAQELLEYFQSYNWRRPELDPDLLLGVIGTQQIGGALEWRPATWLIGDRGTLKSFLQASIAHVHGPGGAVVTADATEAGLRQELKYGSLPVFVDELEPEADPKKVAPVIGLARRASSGSVTLRGTAGHVGQDFVIRSSFFFSSVNLPPMTGAERSRLTILELLAAAGCAPRPIEPRRLTAIGAMIRRRLVDHWARLGTTIEAYRAALIEAGHDLRFAAQYSAILGCRHILLFDREGFEPGELDDWAVRLAIGDDGAIAGGVAEDISDHEQLVVHLYSSPVDAYRSGVREVIGTTVARVAQGSPGTGDEEIVLGGYGLKVEHEVIAGQRMAVLFVANTHQGLSKLLDGTHWAGGRGRTSPWVETLRRIPGATPSETKRFASTPSRATRLVLDQKGWPCGLSPRGVEIV